MCFRRKIVDRLTIKDAEKRDQVLLAVGVPLAVAGAAAIGAVLNHKKPWEKGAAQLSGGVRMI